MPLAVRKSHKAVYEMFYWREITTGCERESQGDQGGVYLNPIRSAKIKLDKSLSVAYGKVEVSARMPKGDWIW